ncbi:MAG: hypothetical protein CM15mP10_0530 [Actinomycetota bacterium]|nr:MAG: hypothetical protein CM15mP10_0530 [Actinomycetota bacterium]
MKSVKRFIFKKKKLNKLNLINIEYNQNKAFEKISSKI